MHSDSLAKAFDNKAFEETGFSLIRFLSHTFENADTRKVIAYKSPDEQYEYWKKDFREKGDSLSLFKEVVDRSILYHHPHYMGHQTAVPALSPVLASLVIDFLSNGMGVYEVGMVGISMERVVCEHLCERFGLGNNAGGFITSGGTLGTLTAILTAKAHYLHHVSKGNADTSNLCIITSEQSHYCVGRAATTMGITADRVIKIPVDDNYRMDLIAMRESYETAIARGLTVFCIVASAPSTSTGTYDDLEGIGQFCQAKGIWFHADGAHGAAAIFSAKYKHLIRGIEHADSIAMDFHKMMLTPGISTAVLLKNRALAFETFRQEAEYLWEKQDYEWQHGGKSTYECTKSMSILKVYSLFKQYGDQIFEDFVDYQYDLTREFASMIDKDSRLEIAHHPDSNILCFRYMDCNNPDWLNIQLRNQLVSDGEYYIVQTTLKGSVFLRVTLLNPRTNITHLQGLIDTIIAAAEQIKATNQL